MGVVLTRSGGSSGGSAGDISWREPALVRDGTLYANITAAQVAANVGDTVDGITINVDDRLLFTNLTAGNENVYIVSGSSGAWTFTEDTNLATDGDALFIQQGTSADQQWTYNGTAWVQFGAAAAAPVTINTINGQPVATYLDTGRAKTLSSSDTLLTFSEGGLADLDWIAIGSAANALTGQVMPMQGTLVYASYMVANDNGNAKELDFYINDVLNTTLFTMPASNATSVGSLNNINIDFTQNDKLQMRAGTTGGTINNVVVNLWVKWRV